jgi:NADP-dependent 3-hydroxy acid dehydrogenase YdfG
MNKLKIVVVGASRGIGAALVSVLQKDTEHEILALSRNTSELEKKFNGKERISYANFDLADNVHEQADKLFANFGQIDVLINNAGLASGLGNLHEGDVEDWEKMIDTNVKGLLYISRIILPGMVERKMGHVVNISSIAGKEVYANGNVYCATKHAVDALNKAMRLELSKFPIKVTAIHPGAVETEFSVVRFHGDKERAAKVYEGFENLVADDIADAIWYAISRPAHVNINELTIMPTAQPMAGVIHRNN